MTTDDRETRDDRLILFDSFDEIPDFASEDDEDAWWQTHDFSDWLADEIVRRERERRARGEPSGSPTDALIRQNQERHSTRGRGLSQTLSCSLHLAALRPHAFVNRFHHGHE